MFREMMLRAARVVPPMSVLAAPEFMRMPLF
jgi:hypothetical protein